MTYDATRSPIHKRLLVGTLLCLLVTGYSLLRYPAILIPLRTGMLFTGVFLMVCLGYIIIIWRLPHNTMADATWSARGGLYWGIVIAVLWLIEIVMGNLADSGKSVVQLTYFSTTSMALILPLIAGFWGTKHSRYIRTGTLVGLYSGLVSGVLTFLILMAMTYLFLNTFRHDAQNILQFQESGTTDLSTFIIGDSLAGGISHLIIGLVSGPGLGAIGGVIGKAITRETDKRDSDTGDKIGSA